MSETPLPAISVQHVDGAIYTISAHVERTLPTVAYFIIDEKITFFDPGPGSFIPIIDEFLRRNPLDVSRVAYIVCSHIHIDHAGSCGYWADRLPAARVLLHPRGAPHMIDPTRLLESTREVFGDAFSQLGGFRPLRPDQIVQVQDGQEFQTGKRSFRTIYSPGHSPHHICLHDERLGSLFAGEALGLPVNDTGVVIPAAAPPNLDVELTFQTVERLERLEPGVIFYGHDGWYRNSIPLIQSLRSNLKLLPDVVLKEAKAGRTAEQISETLLQTLRKLTNSDIEFDLKTDVAGYLRYHRKKGNLPPL